LVIDDSSLVEIYKIMIRIRTFENGVRELIYEGRLPRISFYTGAEAVAASVGVILNKEDKIGSTHRPIGHLIAKGCDIKRILAEINGKKTGLNKGKGGAYHIFDPSVGALGANGIVGGSVPMCAGYALAHQIKGNDRISVSYFGEGASNQGGVQETLNLAACWKLPMVFICENSSTDAQMMLGHEIDYPQLCIEKISDRAASYGMPGSSHDGWDVIEVYNALEMAVNRARRGEGPTLLEFKVHRLNENAEKSPYCPIKCFKDLLIKRGLLDEKLDQQIRDKEIEAFKEALDFAMGSPEPDLLEAFTNIFVEEF
jgi:pyruvate dehydrogenase E1 component alpha subunit